MSPMPLAASTVRSLPFEQDRRGVHHADQTRDTLRAAAARQQADLDLGLADLGLRIGRGDAMVAGEADLEAAAQRGAVDRGHDRLAAGLLAAKDFLQLAELLGQDRGIRGIGVQQHLEIGAGDEVDLARSNDDALDLVVLERLLERAGVGGDRGFVQHVHGAVGHVPGDGGDAVAVDVVVDHDAVPLSWERATPVALIRCGSAEEERHLECRAPSNDQTRSMMVAVPHAAADAQRGEAGRQPRRSSSSSKVPRIIAPWAPSGWPWRWRRRSR